MASKEEPKRTLDCVGLFCPEPLYRTRKNIEALEIGEILEVLADDPTAAKDIARFAKRSDTRSCHLRMRVDNCAFS